jgi:hypothetical protein
MSTQDFSIPEAPIAYDEAEVQLLREMVFL